MQIVIEKTTKIAKYIFKDGENLSLTESGLVCDAFSALDIKPDSHEIVIGPAPDFFVGNALAFNGTWSVLDQSLIDAAIEASTPQVVTMRQARLALLQAGLLDQVDAALAAIPDEAARKAAQIEWEYATEVHRTSPLTLSLGAALSLDDAEMNALFREASAL